MPEPLDTSLLRDFSAFKKSADWNYSLLNYIESRGSIELAVAFASFFWPQFVERRGCIIRAEGFSEDNFEAWWASSKGNCELAELTLNHLHVNELIPGDSTLREPAVMRYLGTTIADCWLNRVRSLYPQRRFRSWLEDVDSDGNPTELTVYLCQE